MTLAPTPVEEMVVLDDVPCRRFDPDLWFADAPAELELAKSLCTECPVRVECLAGALERAEPWGVWGGEIFERGAVIARKRPRGRPRKVDVAAEAAQVLVGTAA
jgi:WhiB family redox-sensing transcriptional regulator